MSEDVRLMEFAKRLKELRTERGLTQLELADKMGTSEPAISRAESGKHNPSLTWIMKAADALGVKPKDLFTTLK